MDIFEKKIEKSERYMKKIKTIKKDYNDLLDSFEKSEEIRKGQKELIIALRSEILKLRKGKEPKSDKDTVKTKVKKNKSKSTTRTKSKKGRKIKS
jgi:hypothetical protein